jgi:hypothetical protein
MNQRKNCEKSVQRICGEELKAYHYDGGFFGCGTCKITCQ